jgi:hypothetical protein
MFIGSILGKPKALNDLYKGILDKILSIFVIK